MTRFEIQNIGRGDGCFFGTMSLAFGDQIGDQAVRHEVRVEVRVPADETLTLGEIEEHLLGRAGELLKMSIDAVSGKTAAELQAATVAAFAAVQAFEPTITDAT